MKNYKFIILAVVLLILGVVIFLVYKNKNIIFTNQSISSKSKLPPDPGEAGKQSLEGVDSDNDGIRDDVQIYIASHYPDPIATAILNKYVKIDQKIILNNQNKEIVLSLGEERRTVAACWDYHFPDDSRKALTYMEAGVVNTPNRLRAYLDADKFFGGLYTLSKDDAAACNSIGI